MCSTLLHTLQQNGALECIRQKVEEGLALSQTTENRKVETRKPLIFRDPIFGFSLQNPTLRQSHHACIEYALTIRSGVKAAVEIDISAPQVQSDLFGYLLQGFQALWEQHHIRFIHGSHGNGC